MHIIFTQKRNKEAPQQRPLHYNIPIAYIPLPYCKTVRSLLEFVNKQDRLLMRCDEEFRSQLYGIAEVKWSHKYLKRNLEE